MLAAKNMVLTNQITKCMSLGHWGRIHVGGEEKYSFS